MESLRDKILEILITDDNLSDAATRIIDLVKTGIDSKALTELIAKYEEVLSALSKVTSLTPEMNPGYPQFVKGVYDIYDIFINDLKALRWDSDY